MLPTATSPQPRINRVEEGFSGSLRSSRKTPVRLIIQSVSSLIKPLLPDYTPRGEKAS